MSARIHYLVRGLAPRAGFVYPAEIEDERYVGFGALYILSANAEATRPVYSCLAVREDRIVDVQLTRLSEGSAFYSAGVEGVGTFIFHAEPLHPPVPYAGAAGGTAPLMAVRRLRSWRSGDLSKAYHDHGFYFMGYSPRIERL